MCGFTAQVDFICVGVAGVGTVARTKLGSWNKTAQISILISIAARFKQNTVLFKAEENFLGLKCKLFQSRLNFIRIGMDLLEFQI